MSSITTQILDNGATKRRFIGVNSIGITDMRHNGNVILTSSQTLLLGGENRINLEIKIKKYDKYGSINSCKLIVKTTTANTDRVLYLTNESSVTSINGDDIDVFYTEDGLTYELDFAKHLYGDDGNTLYFAIRSDAVAYIPSQFYDNCPEVEVIYISPNQGFLNQKYISGNAGRALNYDINVRTGQPFFSKNLISLNGNRMPIHLRLVFNGTHINETWFEGMPYGWKSNYHQKIVSNENGTKTYTDSLGLEHIFTKALNSNTVYFDTAGTGLILTLNSDSTYTMDDGYKNYLDFDNNGYLIKIRKKIGINTISTDINYISGTSKISSIVDGMGREYAFTYNTSDVVISGPGIKDITLTIFDNRLTKVTESGGRYSDYTYYNGLLLSATSDNGEKVVFTYDSIGRVTNASDYFHKEVDTVIDIKNLVYQLTTTTVSNIKSVKIQYSFNEEGECVGEYEVESNGNGTFKIVEKNDFEAFHSQLVKGDFYEFANATASKATPEYVLSCVNFGGEVKSGYKYIISFKYKISDAFPNYPNSSHLLLVYQGAELINTIPLDPRINYEKNVSFMLSTNGVQLFSLKLIHYNLEGTTTIKDVRISKVKFTEIRDCTDIHFGGSVWGITYATGSSWHQLPSSVPFSYYDLEQGKNVDIIKPVTLSDFEENQKNFKMNNNNHHVWYNKKRGLIANTKNVVYTTNGIDYPISSFMTARVYITKNGKRWRYSSYPASLSDPTKLRYEYETILRNGVCDSSSRLISSDFQVLSGTDYNGTSYSYTYDSYGNVLTEEVGSGSNKIRTVNIYLNSDLLLSQTSYVGNAQSSTTSYTYDSCGRVLTVTHPNGSVTSYSYDSNTGNLNKVSETVDEVENYNTINYSKDNVLRYLNGGIEGYEFTYDMYNMMSQSKMFRTGSSYPFVNFENEIGNSYDCFTIRYNDNYTEEVTCDKFGNVILKKYGTSGEATTSELKFFYSDDDVDEISTTDPTSSTLNKTITSKFRKVIDSRSSNTEKYYYNDDGLLSKIINSGTYDIDSKEYEYDDFHRVVTENIINGTTSFETIITYKDENLANLNEVSLIENNVQWDYSGESYAAEYSKNVEFDSLKRINTETIEVGDYSLVKTYTYKKDTNSNTTTEPQIVTYKTKYLSTESNIGTMTYTYDNMGHITKVVDTASNNTANYTYDSLGRLIREDNQKLGTTKRWVYDAYGNIVSRKEGTYTTGAFTPTTTYNYAYNSSYPNRMTSYNGYNVSYNANGNITQLGNWYFSWTRGRLLNSCTKDGMNYTFSYNAKGLRTRKYHISSDYTNYIYDENKLICEHKVTANGEFDINYIYAGNEIIGFTYKNKHYYFVKNIQGDIIKLINSTNNVVATYVYDAWGNHKVYNSSGVESTSSTWIGNINPIRYRGYYYDVETGLFMVGHRYYNPEWGRWLSPDDIEYLDPHSINGLNLYAYCNNDPVNKYDPTGHFAISALIIAAVVGATLGAGVSVVIQAAENDWDWSAVKPELVVVDAVFGAINGALAVSGLGAIGSAITGGLLNGLQTLTESAITGELNTTELWVSMALGFAGGFIPSGFSARNLSGIYKTSTTKLLTAQSTKKIAMYSAKKAFVKSSIIKGSIGYVASTIGSSALDYGFGELGWY